MVSSFLAKWVGQRSRADSEIDEMRAALQRFVSENPQVGAPARWLEHMLPDLRRIAEPVVSLPAPDVAKQKLIGGVPLLRGESLVFDGKALARVWQNACRAMLQNATNLHDREILAAPRPGTLDFHELIMAVIHQDIGLIERRAAERAMEPNLLASLLRGTFFADMVAISQRCEPLQQRAPWERGSCPICGCRALLGEFRGLEQTRFLRCGWCASSWKVPRLFCLDCGNRDHREINFFHRDGEENHLRVAACRACGKYVKMITTLSRLTPVQLWIADLSTLHLDLAAAERGLG